MQYDIISCEIDIYQREIQNYMIIQSKRIMERDTKALANAFEINGKRIEVLIGTNHGFADTLYTDEDKRNHLDITNRMESVQKFLTTLLKRMLPIKNVTGGESLIIRVKDLTQVLEDFTRNIIKDDEVAMRSRCEYLTYIIE